MKLKLFTTTLLVAVALVGCSDTSKENNTEISSSSETSSVENETVNIKELVYDFSMRNITDQSAVIFPNQLIVEAGGKDIVYDLSGEDFFVSIAPYINQTHP
ncbi:MAG: hypothetical protein AB2401_04585 [Bacillus sp. (in: firmicutes)]